MRKFIPYFLTSLLCLSTGPCYLYAAPPSRTTTYTSGTTIRAADVTGNEDSIFNYLRSGIDTYADGTLMDADVNASASISSSKLNLGTISQNVTFTGSNTFSSTNTFAGTTITDLGTVTTGVMTGVDINGGSIDGVTLASSTKLGTIFYSDASNHIATLAPSTAGYVLQTNDTGAAPSWVSRANIQVFTTDGNFTAPTGVTKVYLTMVGGGGGGGALGGGGGGGGAGVINYPYTVVAGNSYVVDVGAAGVGQTNDNGTAGAASVFDSTVTIAGGGYGKTDNTAGAGGVVSLNASTVTGGSYGTSGGNGAAVSGSNGGGGGGSIFGVGGTGGQVGTEAGTAGSGYGAGGGGSYDGSSGNNAGGSAGIVIIMY
jgi:hypothetical protein